VSEGDEDVAGGVVGHKKVRSGGRLLVEDHKTWEAE
jgi:hypothetical protein